MSMISCSTRATEKDALQSVRCSVPICTLQEIFETALADRSRFKLLLGERVHDASQAASLISGLCREDSRARRLAVHWVFDRSRAGNFLDSLLQVLSPQAPQNTMLRDLLAQACPERKPLLVAHRGAAQEFPENTLSSIRAALSAGYQAVEVDLCITRDGQIVLWHDWRPNDPIAIARTLGGEAGLAYRPAFPRLGSRQRAAVDRLTLAELRATHGYKKRGASIFSEHIDAAIDTLRDLLYELRQHEAFKMLVLDLKIPPGSGPRTARFARALGALLEETGMRERALILHTDQKTIRTLKAEGLGNCTFSCDVVIKDFFPSAPRSQAGTAAQELRNAFASIGRPLLMFNGFEYYLELLRHDRDVLDASREDEPAFLMCWTINDELEFREILAAGVDALLTDNLNLFQEVLREVFP